MSNGVLHETFSYKVSVRYFSLLLSHWVKVGKVHFGNCDVGYLVLTVGGVGVARLHCQTTVSQICSNHINCPREADFSFILLNFS